MPPGTKLRNVRVADDLWLAAKDATSQHGDTLADVVRAALVAYVAQHGVDQASETTRA